MKKFACVAVVLAAFGLLGAMYITQNESLVSGALSDLKFESIPPKAGVMGAPPKFKVTDETIKYLQKLQKDGTIIEIGGDGKITVKPTKDWTYQEKAPSK